MPKTFLEKFRKTNQMSDYSYSIILGINSGVAKMVALKMFQVLAVFVTLIYFKIILSNIQKYQLKDTIF